MPIPIPKNERERLVALRRYDVLDTPPEEIFDWITHALADQLSVPISYVALLDETRQWFKSRHGMVAKETPREIAFCAYGIVCNEPLVVEDATKDPRFADNPMVTGEFGVRFYCGVPLRTKEQFTLGTLSVMDRSPRRITKKQMAVQIELADLVVKILELRLAARKTLEFEHSARVSAEQISQERLLELERSEALKTTILQSAFDAIVSIDDSGRILEWNKAAEEIFGHRRADAIGGQMSDLIVPPRLREDHKAGFQRYLGSGELQNRGRPLELIAMRQDGEEFPVEVAITSDNSANHHVISGFLRDVTDKRRTEENLRQSQKMEAIGQLTGGLAHDFNNLLAVISGNAEMALQGLGDSDRHLKMIMETTDRGAQLTQHLLAFARQQPLRTMPVHCGGLVQDTLAMLVRTLGETIKINVVKAPDLWLTEIDASLLGSAILNLAVNARDAMPNGGILTIEATNARFDDADVAGQADLAPGDYVMISVGDNGRGIPPESLEHVFEPFFTTKEAGRGTGLGLSMVYGFVKQSGGYVTIDSNAGEGTTVRLYLPRYLGAEGAQETPSPATDRIDGGQGETVLLVEDDKSLRDLMTEVLGSLGYDVLVAEQGKAALALLDGNPQIELLLTDMMLPGGMNGTEIARAARERRPGLPVLYMTGHSEHTIFDSGRLDKDANLLQKPFRRAQIARVIREMLSPAKNR